MMPTVKDRAAAILFDEAEVAAMVGDNDLSIFLEHLGHLIKAMR